MQRNLNYIIENNKTNRTPSLHFLSEGFSLKHFLPQIFRFPVYSCWIQKTHCKANEHIITCISRVLPLNLWKGCCWGRRRISQDFSVITIHISVNNHVFCFRIGEIHLHPSKTPVSDSALITTVKYPAWTVGINDTLWFAYRWLNSMRPFDVINISILFFFFLSRVKVENSLSTFYKYKHVVFRTQRSNYPTTVVYVTRRHYRRYSWWEKLTLTACNYKGGALHRPRYWIYRSESR